jgi:hypothetical protein
LSALATTPGASAKFIDIEAIAEGLPSRSFEVGDRFAVNERPGIRAAALCALHLSAGAVVGVGVGRALAAESSKQQTERGADEPCFKR